MCIRYVMCHYQLMICLWHGCVSLLIFFILCTFSSSSYSVDVFNSHGWIGVPLSTNSLPQAVDVLLFCTWRSTPSSVISMFWFLNQRSVGCRDSRRCMHLGTPLAPQTKWIRAPNTKGERGRKARDQPNGEPQPSGREREKVDRGSVICSIRSWCRLQTKVAISIMGSVV